MPLSARAQNDRMRAEFPGFKLVLDAGFMAAWEGELTPFCQTYRVRITYIARRFFKNFTVANPSVSIIVLDPLIGPDPRGTGEPPEHTYRWQRPPEYPALCVFDPLTDEWTREKSIADTLMPMIIKWFIFFEDWVIDGVWRGGGRHPELPPMEDACPTAPLSPEDRARRARSRSAAFHSLGRKIGVFGSYPWMEEAYAACFLPRFSPSSSAATAAIVASPNILTSSPAPRPAASSPSVLAQDARAQNSSGSISTAALKSSPNVDAQSRAA